MSFCWDLVGPYKTSQLGCENRKGTEKECSIKQVQILGILILILQIEHEPPVHASKNNDEEYQTFADA